ncbi:thioesterase family protein [Gallaecimonas sp. GXIMD4217]|uniref:thioesterase family protein n=1 Tax=Gallaecimonas sp. GXIMD4217 TaxID=3131927 RepID=UPI00311B1D6B
MHTPLSQAEILDFIGQLFTEQMPFNRLLGLKVSRYDAEQVEVRFAMNEQLIGNPIHKILHGGVTASVLDVVGGLAAIASVSDKFDGETVASLAAKFGKMGTIDMRVDYLRPGRGLEFIATATVIRAGNKVAVTRMELHNEQGDHIAFGTGTYMVG